MEVDHGLPNGLELRSRIRSLPFKGAEPGEGHTEASGIEDNKDNGLVFDYAPVEGVHGFGNGLPGSEELLLPICFSLKS